MIKYCIPIISVMLCAWIGFFRHTLPIPLPFEVSVSVIIGIALLGLLMQIILMQRLQINALKRGKRAKTLPEIPEPTQSTTIDIEMRLRDSEAFALRYLGIRDLRTHKIAGDYALIDFFPTSMGSPVPVNTILADSNMNGQYVMMIFARMLLLLNKHDTARQNIFVSLPMSVLNHPLLAASLQQMTKIWQHFAPRSVFVLKAQEYAESTAGLEVLRRDGAHFGLQWHESLLEADYAALQRAGVRFIFINFATLVALQQDSHNAALFRHLNLVMRNTEIQWIIQELNSLTPVQPLIEQEFTLVLDQEV